MNAIEIKGVSKYFDKFKLDNISFDLPEGCIVGLIGENGAGKTTTIKLILDNLNVDEGSIKVLGVDNKLVDKNDIGVVSDNFGIPESLNLYKVEDVMSNIFSRWNHEEFVRISTALNIPTDKRYKDLSTGNKMKVALCVAMSHNAKLLILDEPTNGLDPVIRDEVVGMLFEFTRDETHSILISSHIVSDLQKLCDYIVIIHEGKILLNEEKDEILENYGVVSYGIDEEIPINKNAIIRCKKTSYNNELLVRKDQLDKQVKTNSINLEDMFVFMIRGEKIC